MNPPDLPALPRDADGPVFSAPWQAQAFAMAVALNEVGLLDWAEWAATLSEHLHAPDAADDGSDYYAHWLETLEDLLARHGHADPAEVAALTEAWQRAARATPHGRPILLENDPGPPPA